MVVDFTFYTRLSLLDCFYALSKMIAAYFSIFKSPIFCIILLTSGDAYYRDEELTLHYRGSNPYFLADVDLF